MLQIHEKAACPWFCMPLIPALRELETRIDMAKQREEHTTGRDRSSAHSVQGLVETGSFSLWYEDLKKVKSLSSD